MWGWSRLAVVVTGGLRVGGDGSRRGRRGCLGNSDIAAEREDLHMEPDQHHCTLGMDTIQESRLSRRLGRSSARFLERRNGNENATYLANVEVRAVIFELGVVGEHGGGVGLVLVGDALDGVVGLDDVGRLAVAALETEAQVPADLEVSAEVVDGGVHGAELVPAEQVTPISMCSE